MALWPIVRNLVRSPSASAPNLSPKPSAKAIANQVDTQPETLSGPNWTIPVVYLSGTPYEMGWQHGHALQAQICQLTRDFYGEFARGPAGFFYQYLLPGRLYHLWKAVPQAYQEELRGVADGAKLPLQDILLINFFDDVLNLLELGWAFACSTLMARGEGDRPLMGRNLDYNGPVGDLVRHFQTILVRQPSQPDASAVTTTVTVGVAGHVGVLTGMNDRGLSLGSMTSQSSEQNWHGLGVSLLYRLLLDRATSVNGAIALFERHTPAQGNNLMLADERAGARIEFTSARRTIAHLQSSYLGISNHYLDPQLATTHTNLYKLGTAAGSQSRYGRLCLRADSLNMPADPASLAAAMTDDQLHEGYPHTPIDRWRSNAVVNNQGTLHSVIFDPQNRCLQVALGLGERPIQSDDFVTYQPFDRSLPLSPTSQAQYG